MSRLEGLRSRLNALQEYGVIRDGWYISSDGRRRWVLHPFGYSERELSTVEVEAFIMGANAALGATRATPR